MEKNQGKVALLRLFLAYCAIHCYTLVFSLIIGLPSEVSYDASAV